VGVFSEQSILPSV